MSRIPGFNDILHDTHQSVFDTSFQVTTVAVATEDHIQPVVTDLYE